MTIEHANSNIIFRTETSLVHRAQRLIFVFS